MEIIKRTSDIDRESFRAGTFGTKMQVSYNNYGHLVIRMFESNFKPVPVKWASLCMHDSKPIHTVNGSYPTWYHDETDNAECVGVINPDHPHGRFYAEPNEDIPMTKPVDVLLTFTESESRDIIRFIKEVIH